MKAIQKEDLTRFVFGDETSTTLPYCHRYGRAPAGQRLHQAGALRNGPHVTLSAALTPAGFGALLRVDEAANGAVFADHPDQVLSPTLRPGDVVVLDNCPIHRVTDLEAVLDHYGTLGRGGCTCHPIRPILILIPLNKPSANLNPGSARPRPAPATCWKRRWWPPPGR